MDYRLLLSRIPEHTAYVEPFSSRQALLYAKPPSQVEIYNDSDSELVNFFRVLQDTDRFERFVGLALADEPVVTDDPAAVAVDWYRQISGIRNNETSIDKDDDGQRDWLDRVPGLKTLHARLMQVQIEHRPIDWLFGSYDSADTFFYLRPPPHIDLTDTVLRLDAKVMLLSEDARYADLGWSQQGNLYQNYDTQLLLF